MTRRAGRLALSIIAGVGTLGGLLIGVAATPASAAAGNVPGRVDTAGLMLNVRTGPTTAAKRVATIAPGRRIVVQCQQPGQQIAGRVRTTRQWDRLPDGRFVSDAYVVRSAAVVSCAEFDQVGQVMPPATHPPAPSKQGWVAPVPGVAGSGYRTKERPSHDGVDIAARRHTPIRATAAGRVIVSECNASTDNCDVDGSPKIGGCGWYVEVAHADRVVTRYCHMVRRPAVNVGDTVGTGQVIGYVGSSGNSSGPHLHFETHTNAPPATRKNAVEPVAFLKARGVTLS
jgi:murein DD-endopeptidase MepM/ murein hydrolase activator NlpD